MQKTENEEKVALRADFQNKVATMRDQFIDLSDSDIDEIQDMIDDENENEFLEVCSIFIKNILNAAISTMSILIHRM